ncbi:MAG: hypothetical protein ACI8P0_006163, partial [Planctomycetaceae bacterium]
YSLESPKAPTRETGSGLALVFVSSICRSWSV